jgi:hypothetical protein
MEGICPLCNTDVQTTLRIGTSAAMGIEEEVTPTGQRELGTCQQGHELARWLDDYGWPREPWRELVV